MSMPYSLVDYYNFGRELQYEEHIIRVIVATFSTRINSEQLNIFKNWIEKESAHVMLVLYRERDEECEEKSRNIEAFGAPLSQRLIWRKIDGSAVRFLAGLGVALYEKMEVDDAKVLENALVYLRDFNLKEEIDTWIEQNRRKASFVFDLKWPIGYAPADISVHRRYWLLGYPEFLTPKDLPVDLLCLGGPRHSLKARIEEVSRILSGFFLEREGAPERYRVGQSALEVWIFHHLLRNGIDKIMADKFSNHIINLNEGLTPSRCLDIVLSFLEEKCMMEKTGGLREYTFLPLSDPNEIKKIGEDLIKRARDALKLLEEKDKYEASPKIYERYVKDKLWDVEPKPKVLDYPKTWGGKVSLDSLRIAFTKMLSKLQGIYDNFPVFVSMYEELLIEAKKAGEGGLGGAKELMVHLCKLTIPTYLLKGYIVPQITEFHNLLSEYWKKGYDYVDSLHSQEFKEVCDVSELAKEYHKNGNFEDLERTYLRVKALKEAWDAVKEEAESVISRLQSNITSLKIKYDELDKKIASASNPLTPKFSQYLLSLSLPYLDLIVDTQIRDKMSEKRKEVFAGISMEDPNEPARIMEELRGKLDDLKRNVQEQLEQAEDFLNGAEELLASEEEIISFDKQVTAIQEKLNDLEGNEEAVGKINEWKSDIESQLESYKTLSPEVFFTEISKDKIDSAKSKLTDIEKELSELYEKIGESHKKSFEKLDGEKEYLEYLIGKVKGEKKKERLVGKLGGYTESKKWRDKRRILDDVFKQTVDTLESEGFNARAINVLRIIFDELKRVRFDEKISIHEATKKVSQELSVEVDEMYRDIIELLKGDFLEGYLDLKKSE